MTELLAFAIFALTVISAMGILFALALRQSVRDFAQMQSELDQRRQAEVQSLLNRLMAIRWEDFITVEETQTADEGGFFPPEGPSEDDTMVGGQWGRLSNMRERAEALEENERQLLLEDFPEGE